MKSRKSLHIALSALFIVCLSLLGIAKSIKTDTKQDIDNFIKALEENKITRIEVYYYAWGDPAMHTTEEDMINGRYEYKITRNLPSITSTNKIKQIFREVKFPIIEDKYFNLRLMYVFYSEKKEILRLSFSSFYPVVYINGQSCQCHPRLLSELLPLLPKEPYETVYFSMLDLWSQAK